MADVSGLHFPLSSATGLLIGSNCPSTQITVLLDQFGMEVLPYEYHEWRTIGSDYCGPTPYPTSYSPSMGPTNAPSESPTLSPSFPPSQSPSSVPTFSPSYSPSESPSIAPSLNPSESPTPSPTFSPSMAPTRFPTETDAYDSYLDVTYILLYLPETFIDYIATDLINIISEITAVIEQGYADHKDRDSDRWILYYHTFWLKVESINDRSLSDLADDAALSALFQYLFQKY